MTAAAAAIKLAITVAFAGQGIGGLFFALIAFIMSVLVDSIFASILCVRSSQKFLETRPLGLRVSSDN